MPTLHLIIKGKVQGVFYRASAKKIAHELLITGWIRNMDNNDVEALVTGTSIQLRQFVEWCNRGPSKALVHELIETEKEEILFNTFTIR